jgi:hypothetical protein
MLGLLYALLSASRFFGAGFQIALSSFYLLIGDLSSLELSQLKVND